MNQNHTNVESDSVPEIATISQTSGITVEGPTTAETDGESDAVIVSQPSNPITKSGAPFVPSNGADSGSELGVTTFADSSEPPPRGKRGRPKGSKNKPGAKQPATKKLSKKEPVQGLTWAPPPTTEAQKPAELRNVARADIVLCEPFSTLLPIREDTYRSIKAAMGVNGFDPTHPVHLWDRDGRMILADGCTRIKAAAEVGIAHIPAFIHHFRDESEALEFAIRCQTDRRNITDGELFALVAVYDQKVKPGSTQQRNEGGTFAPKASNDASGKSAKKTAAVLKTTTTGIERARYLLKHATAETKAAVTNNKMPLSRACEVTRKSLAAQTKLEKNPPEAKGGRKGKSPLPFDLTTDSDVATAVWHPVTRAIAEPSNDLGAEVTKQAEDVYALVEDALELPLDPKKLPVQARRVLVLPELDLFAEEVPAKLIRSVLKAAVQAKQFNFLFVTQNPARLQEFSWESNTFAGVSIFGQKDIAPAEEALRELEGLGKWLVVEQLTMELTFQHLDQVDWLVVRQGAGVPGVEPDPRALKSLLRQAWAADCPVLFERGIVYRPADHPNEIALTNKKEEVHRG